MSNCIVRGSAPALSDGRSVHPKTGMAPAVGNAVDVRNANCTTDIGDPELIAAWTDPDFDAKSPASAMRG